MQALKKHMQSFSCCGLECFFRSLTRLGTRNKYDLLTEAESTAGEFFLSL